MQEYKKSTLRAWLTTPTRVKEKVFAVAGCTSFAVSIGLCFYDGSTHITDAQVQSAQETSPKMNECLEGEAAKALRSHSTDLVRMIRNHEQIDEAQFGLSSAERDQILQTCADRTRYQIRKDIYAKTTQGQAMGGIGLLFGMAALGCYAGWALTSRTLDAQERERERAARNNPKREL